MKKFRIRPSSLLSRCDVYSGTGILSQLWESSLSGNYSSQFVIADRRVFQLHGDSLLNVLLGTSPRYLLPSGEAQKSDQRFNSILNWLYRCQADRHSLIIAVGGGVVTDLAGFAAACYMRGIDFLSVPTTLVGQLDAAIGGKTGINLQQTKNLVGTFHFPKAVICDHIFLETLSADQIKDGLVEAIKIFTACDRAAFLKYRRGFETSRIRRPMERIVADAIRLKVDIVNADPLEKGLRKVLNFGHTTGHAYEALTGASHGKAVAFGILVALELSRALLKLPERDRELTVDATLTLYRDFEIRTAFAQRLWQKILHDKKRRQGKIYFTLLRKLGQHAVHPVNYEEFKRGLHSTMERLKK